MDLSVLGYIIVIGILRGGIYVLMALGLSLAFGVMNISNFAHGEFYMLGAYYGFFARTVLGLGPLLSIVVAAVGGLLTGAIVEKAVFYPLRKKSTSGNWIMDCFLVTAGLSFILKYGVQYVIGVEYKGVSQSWPGTLNILGVQASIDRVVAFVIAMIVVLVFWWFLQKTKTGNAIRAVSENETGAMLLGINLNKIQTLTMSLSCMLATIGGAALISINPAYPTMGLRPLYKSWFVVIIVGLGNIWGTIIGGFIVGLLEAFTYFGVGAGWHLLVTVAVICLILVIKPSGIFGTESVKGIWEQ